MARYWSIAAVPLSAHPSPLVITTKLAAAIYGGALYGGGALQAHQYCPCGTDHILINSDSNQNLGQSVLVY